MSKKKNENKEESKEKIAENIETAAEQTEKTEQETFEKEENELEKAQNEINRLKDQVLRQAAEFDNYRKRTLKEKASLILNGGEKTIKALLPVLDDFERAIDNITKTNDIKQLQTGVELIFKKLIDTLHKEGLKNIDTTDKDFDTDYHEAVAMVPVEDENKKGKVIDCVQTGYQLNDKVIRHAKVAIGQ